MFKYGGLVDLTEYYVRRTEIDSDADSVFRVRVCPPRKRLDQEIIIFLF